MEAQRVRKPFSVFTPCVTNYSIFHLLGKTRLVVSVIQSQACCQLHQGAAIMELRGLEPLTSWVRSRRSPS